MQHTTHSQGANFSATARPLSYVGAVGLVFATVGLAFLVNRLMPHASLSLLFLTGVSIVSARIGLGPSLVASVLSFLAFNFFFTPPYHTFEVAHDGDVATLVFFLLMAAITGNVAARMHARRYRPADPKTQHQVWFQGQDLVDLRAGEGGHSRFFVARLPRAHGEAGNAHDAMLLAEQVQRLGGLLGQADDALWSLIVI